ncbi:MAG TPA: hypothetical protein VMV05_03090 [bacterium]|nr:hypothetical protein [bacterium]
MFIGHYAVGFAAKKWAPKTSLATLVGAAIWLDLVWPVFVLLGWEHFNISPNLKVSPLEFVDYPLSHSLVMAAAWGVAFGAVYLILKNDLKTAGILAGLVVSHWVLDLLVHRRDLPLLPAEGNNWDAHKYGFKLWDHPAVSVPLEFLLFGVGIWIYLKATKSLDRAGSVGLWCLALFLAGTFIWSINSPPPPNTSLVAFMSQLQVLVVIAAYYVDGHRKAA